MMRTAHVIGAGLAGLAAAVRLAEAGWNVEIAEAAPQAGGRCRSYFDRGLGVTIDNGNHLVLSANRRTLAFLETIGARHHLRGPDEAKFSFVDLATGEGWDLRINDGPLAWWVLFPGRRVPRTSVGAYLALMWLLFPKSGATIGETIATEGRLYSHLLAPILVSALNTDPAMASARLAAAVLRESLLKGGRACRPLVATEGLSGAFIDPALAYIAARGGAFRPNRRLTALESDGDRASFLRFGAESRALTSGECVVLAVPPWAAAELLPGLSVPQRFNSIVNGHFLHAPPPGMPPVLGVINGTVEWIFAFEGRLSVTVSNADRLAGLGREELARRLWGDVANALGLTQDLPRWQVVTEKRATFAATPEQDRRRPGAATPLKNLFLAGDWTDTGLPATIEGAIRSGETAAEAALALQAAP